MGESSISARKSASLKQRLLSTDQRCIYCPGEINENNITIEHMPPISMFKGRIRPQGMEFAACKSCNNATRGADSVAAFMARISPHEDQPDWRIAEAIDLVPAVNADAPGVFEEFKSSLKKGFVTNKGLIVREIVVNDGPLTLTNKYLDIFASKFAMAVYRHCCGHPLPMNGEFVYRAFMNAGLNQKIADAILNIMPMHGQLIQGSFSSNPQFIYRLNTDEKSIVAALAQFNDGLHVFSLVYADQERYGRLPTPPHHKRGRPGQLLSMLPPRAPPPRFRVSQSGLILPRSIKRPRMG